MIEKIPIVEMTHECDVTKSIVRLPYCDIADIVSWVGEREPLAVIPPYSKSTQFSARAASLIRDHTRSTIMVAVVEGNPQRSREVLQSFREEGFFVFAFPGELGDVPLEHLFHTAPEGGWFHIAGRCPSNKDRLAGKWTWSEEGL